MWRRTITRKTHFFGAKARVLLLHQYTENKLVQCCVMAIFSQIWLILHIFQCGLYGKYCRIFLLFLVCIVFVFSRILTVGFICIIDNISIHVFLKSIPVDAFAFPMALSMKAMDTPYSVPLTVFVAVGTNFSAH